MEFFKRFMNGTGDDFGIDGLVAGIQSVKSRLEAEQAKLKQARDDLRDNAMDDGDMDEGPVLRAQARVDALVSALEKARSDANSLLNKQRPQIEAKIADLEKKKMELLERRDREWLAILVAFLRDTGAVIQEAPRKGSGGYIRVPSTAVLEKKRGRRDPGRPG